jgi:hypothetical protein
MVLFITTAMKASNFTCARFNIAKGVAMEITTLLLYPEDGGSRFLRNAGNDLIDYKIISTIVYICPELN